MPKASPAPLPPAPLPGGCMAVVARRPSPPRNPAQALPARTSARCRCVHVCVCVCSLLWAGGQCLTAMLVLAWPGATGGPRLARGRGRAAGGRLPLPRRTHRHAPQPLPRRGQPGHGGRGPPSQAGAARGGQPTGGRRRRAVTAMAAVCGLTRGSAGCQSPGRAAAPHPHAEAASPGETHVRLEPPPVDGRKGGESTWEKGRA